MSYRHHEFEPDASTRPIAPPPTPHARKKPDITLNQLEVLNLIVAGKCGVKLGGHAVRSLAKRGLIAGRKTGNYYATNAGRLLIRTQYDALKRVLTERAK
jgi:hypothetical protein